MKKLMFALFFTAYGITVSAQEVYHVYECGVATYSDASEQWTYDKPSAVDLTFLLQHKVLLANDQSHSTYVLGEEFQHVMTDDLGAFGWYAVDEAGRKCAVKIVLHRTGSTRFQINVIYGHTCYFYNATRESR